MKNTIEDVNLTMWQLPVEVSKEPCNGKRQPAQRKESWTWARAARGPGSSCAVEPWRNDSTSLGFKSSSAKSSPGS